MLTPLKKKQRLRTHDRAPNPKRPTSDICHSI